MKFDRATRSFLALLAVAVLVGALVCCGALGGVLLPMLFLRLTGNGPDALRNISALPAFVLLALVTISMGIGARSFACQLSASRRLARYVSGRSVAMPSTFLPAAAAYAEMDGHLLLVDAPEAFSFVFGVLTPLVAVSRGLVEDVSAD
jgi:hypothetical protein